MTILATFGVFLASILAVFALAFLVLIVIHECSPAASAVVVAIIIAAVLTLMVSVPNPFKQNQQSCQPSATNKP